METGTSTEETPIEETPEEKTEEPAEEDTSEQKTELDSVKETLAETQEVMKRYKEQVSGSQTEAEKLRTEITELKSKIPQKEESPSELSEQDLQYKAYLKKLGMYSKNEVDKLVQDRIAPFQAKEAAKAKANQKAILDKFIKGKPELSSVKDIDGSKMQKVIAQLKRITPIDPLNPNTSLDKDLELAYKWAFEGETNKEAISKAKAAGRAEGHEAGEAKVGGGASVKSTHSGKQRTSDQEAILKEWGVDDDTIKKNKEK